MRKLIVCIFLAYSFISFAQIGKRKLVCRVVDEETSKPIAEVNVSTPNLTSSSITNQLGFFQLEILRTEIELSISRIGYEAVIIQVPEVDKFQIKLKKEFVQLPFIDLKRPLINEVDIDPFWRSAIDSFPNNANAVYRGGWRSLSNDIIQVLKTEAVLACLNDTLVHVRFSVEIDGSFSIMSVVPKKEIIYDLFRSSAKLNHWKAAVQNNKPRCPIF